MPNNQAKKTAFERRVRASWRTRACAAALCVGAQVFLGGCAVGMPLALSSVWLAALPALPLCAWITFRCHRALLHPAQTGKSARIAYALLAAALLSSGAFAASSMVCFAGATLASQTREAWIAVMAGVAAMLCALSGGTGVSRLCFALRYVFPAALLGFSAAAMPLRAPAGLFPILGAGAFETGTAALCMLFGAAPALMLALPPPELAKAREGSQPCSVPPAGFFVRRVLAGALAGCLLLLLSSAAVTYESIAESTQWGARLRMAAGNLAHEGIPQMLLTVTKLLAMLLLCTSMLCAAEQALLLAFPNLAKGRAGLLLLTALLFAALAAMIILGERPLLLAAPGIAAPAVLGAWLIGRRRKA